MKLLYQTHSPFARKALVFAHEIGIADQVTVEHHETSPTNANAEVFAENPLGKVPVLLRPGRSALFDSNVICAFFDTLHDGRPLVPADPEERWAALRLEALAQEMAQAGIAVRWESTRRPEHLRYPQLQEGYELKLKESYRWLERADLAERDLNIGHIALATTLDWLEFRDLPSFRDQPRLTLWFDDFVQRRSMQLTPLSGETQD